jgi:probable F420-dependent oxidoreductase
VRLGTLIPHFGRYAGRDAIIRGSARAEELGFDSLWARDHLIWEPHGIEGTDKTFVDPFETLAAAAAVTERVTLGTAVVIPVRWPLKLAQEFMGLSFMSDGRVVAGVGLGFNPREFEAAGLRAEDREAIFEETVEILRATWAPGPCSHHGAHFSIDDVEIEPKPVAPIPILYGGTTPAAVRRAARKTDGWYCGRLPLATLDARMAYLREQAPDRTLPTIIQPLVIVARTTQEAADRLPLDLLLHSSEGSRLWVRPASGEFRSIEDLEGLVLYGSPDDVIRQSQAFIDRGIDELVFDLRLQFDEYVDALELIGKEVLPALRDRSSSVDEPSQWAAQGERAGPLIVEA